MTKGWDARMKPVESINPFSARFVCIELITKLQPFLKNIEKMI